MRKLNESALQIGDIILTTTTDLLSKGIRKVTGSDISHALICVESYSVIDATGDGVHSRNWTSQSLTDIFLSQYFG
jgi:hypothetical protein